MKNPGGECEVKEEFQCLLKSQVEENSKLRKELSGKVDEIYNIRADMEEMRCKIREKEDEISIIQKKMKAQEKNYKI